MCYTAKESILSLSVMLGISAALYVRNVKYDRMLCVVIIIISLIQLVEYFFHMNMMSESFAGKSIYIVLWLQVLVLGIAMHLYYNTTFTRWWGIAFVAVFIVACFYLSYSTFTVSYYNGHLLWSSNGKPGNILGGASPIYLIGLIFPFILALYYSNWKDTGLYLLLVAIALSIIFVKWKFPSVSFSSLWCYSAVFIAFTAWMVNAFCGNGNTCY